MRGSEYQKLAMRTNDGKSGERMNQRDFDAKLYHGASLPDLFNACLGLAGETGELLDMVKKYVFHDKPLDEEHLKKELGDCMWYVAMFCHAMNWNLDEIMRMNVDKLKARYPEGFDTEKSNHRTDGDV